MYKADNLIHAHCFLVIKTSSTAEKLVSQYFFQLVSPAV